MKGIAAVVGSSSVQDTQADARLESAWAIIRTGLRRDIGARMFDQWLKAAILGDYCVDSQTLDLLFASDFTANFVSGHFGDRLRMAWRSAGVGVREVRLRRAPNAVGPRLLEIVAEEQAATPDPVLAAAPSACNFQPRHRFEDFVTGETNHLAFSAAKAMAQEAQPRFNPLFIHGSTGQGKTHLLHAIAQDFSAHSPSAPVLYMSAERFMMEFVNAMRANETMMFKARLRAARLLLIDDIQFIAGKGSTQEEFLHTINDLIDSGARIVVTA
ncbi:MAG TPA: DnaA/Hda family protein, partial [Rhizorhapis sp.]|nr:DnaA/Hda family protein [Rhizorhapis sp.]